MKQAILGFAAAAFLVVPVGFAGSAKKMVCTETGKEIKSCCCAVKDGKFVCKMTNKAFEKCCCESQSR